MIEDIALSTLPGMLGGIFGGMASAEDRQNALNANRQALQQWLDVHIPDIEAQKVALQKYVQTGQLTPQLEQAVKQSDSEYKNVNGNEAAKSAQLRALSSLEDEGMMGGLGIADKAAMNEAEINANTSARGRADAITSQMAQRGLSGSGLDLVAQMQNAQNANQIQAKQQTDAAVQARQRALDSIMGAGHLGGQIEQQAYAEQSGKAKAQDAINRFNAENLQDVNRRNVGYLNDAQKYNLNNQQNIANSNVDLANKEQMHNKGLYQTQFDDQLRKAQGTSGAYGNMANAYNNNADRTFNQWNNAGKSINKGVSSYLQNRQDDEEEDVYA